MGETSSAENRVTAREMAFEAGLLHIIRSGRRPDSQVLFVVTALLAIVSVGEQLTLTDIAILKALLQANGNRSAAARLLAPGRPSYRRYVCRRVKKFVEIIQSNADSKMPAQASAD